jgi:hypothetical protein
VIDLVDLEALAARIELLAVEEWDRILLRREYRAGEPDAGSSFWDGRQAALRDAARMVREAVRPSSGPCAVCQRTVSTRCPGDHRDDPFLCADHACPYDGRRIVGARQ